MVSTVAGPSAPAKSLTAGNSGRSISRISGKYRSTRIPANALSGDARDIGALLDPQSVDAVICSPPYPNEKDYLRIVRLESVLLGFIKNQPQLRSLKQRLARALPT